MHLGILYKIQALEIKKRLDEGTANENSNRSMKQKFLLAIENLNKSIELDDTEYENFNHLAEAYIEIQKWKKAIEAAILNAISEESTSWNEPSCKVT